MTYEELRAKILADIKPAIEEAVTPLKQKQTDWMSQFVERKPEQEEPKGLKAARLIRSLVAGRGDPGRASVFARDKLGDEVIAKALAATTDTAGGFMIAEEVARDVIELLRPSSTVRSLNPVMVSLSGNTLRLPRMTAGATATWIGENSNIGATEQTFGTVNLTPKKLAALVPVSNDLIRRVDQNTDIMIRDDLVASIAQATDLAYLRGAVGGNDPTGMLNIVGAQLFPSATSGATNDTLQNITTDIAGAMQRMMEQDVRMIRPGWIFAPRSFTRLMTVRDGNGNLAFKSELDRGTFFGWPFKITSQIPTNLDVSGNATNDESEVYFVDFADIVLGDATSLLIDVSTEAAYHDGANVVAAFSLDQTVIRAIFETDINTRHVESVVVIQEVRWGVDNL